MKKLHFILVCALTAMLLCSCQKITYKSFVGTWGVEKIDYQSYNTDYAGNPIQASLIESHFVFDPNDTNDGMIVPLIPFGLTGIRKPMNMIAIS